MAISKRALKQLRDALMRLTAQLETLRLHGSAAYLASAVDALNQAPPLADEEPPRSDIECQFELDEHGRVWMIRDGDCHIIGRKDYILAEMWRFLRGLPVEPL